MSEIRLFTRHHTHNTHLSTSLELLWLLYRSYDSAFMHATRKPCNEVSPRQGKWVRFDAVPLPLPLPHFHTSSIHVGAPRAFASRCSACPCLCLVCLCLCLRWWWWCGGACFLSGACLHRLVLFRWWCTWGWWWSRVCVIGNHAERTEGGAGRCSRRARRNGG